MENFKRVCSHFFDQHPGEIIGRDQFIVIIAVYCVSDAGIHCTHGYNRTGFLIISYLVEVEDWRYIPGLLIMIVIIM